MVFGETNKSMGIGLHFARTQLAVGRLAQISGVSLPILSAVALATRGLALKSHAASAM